MHNPYAHSQGPAPATPEDQLLADYELAVGKNVEYYVPKFEEFDKGASQLGWNWPAFFFTTPWFLYRKMWGWGLGNAAYFWGMLTFVTPIVMGIAVGAAGKAQAVSTVITVGIIMGVLLAIPWFVLPMYANALYWRQVKKVIRDVPRSFQDQPDKRMSRIRRNGGVGAGAMIGVLAGAAFLFIFIIGILAAIAIPAYQDYTIRAQVTEGLNLASVPKAVVAEYYAQHGEWPLDSATAGVGELNGTYVDAVRVANGSIVITYGNRANRTIQGQRLIISPGLTQRQDIVWTCGERIPPDEVVTRGPGPTGSDIAAKHLPVSCRPH